MFFTEELVAMLAVHQLMEENFSKPFQTFERRNEAIPGFYAANELNNLGNNRFSGKFYIKHEILHLKVSGQSYLPGTPVNK